MMNVHDKRQAHGGLPKRQVGVLTVPGAATPAAPAAGGAGTTSPAAAAPAPPATSPTTTTTPATPAPAPAPVAQTTVTTTSTSTAPPPDTRTQATTTSTSSTSTTPTTTTSSTRTTPTTTTSSRTTTLQPSTSINIIIKSLSVSSSPTLSLLAASSSASPDSGSPTGTIIGAVAGALVGVVVLSGLIGYLFRAKFSKKDHDDDDPFSRDDFRRESVMLPDEDEYDGMSQISGGRSAGHGLPPGLGRSDTVNSGASAGPRPPTFIQRHLNHAMPAQPSYQPGQLVNHNFYGNSHFPNAAPVSSDQGGWGVAAAYGGHPAHPQDGYDNSGLARQATQRTAYSDGRGNHPINQHTLPGLDEDGELPSRSGTPVDPNPQSAYYAHGSRAGSADQNPTSTSQDYNTPKRRMSVRNGGLDEYGPSVAAMRPQSTSSDVYGGVKF